jgi:hypothetical protein
VIYSGSRLIPNPSHRCGNGETVLLLYLLLRFQAFLHQWPHSFTRLFTLLRAVLWDRFDLRDLLAFYGTAAGPWRMRAQPEQGYLPGFAPVSMGQHAA